MKAMQTELECLRDHNAWDLVEAPDNVSLIKGRWVYTIKTDVNGKPAVFKARWVARGFTQQEGIDYNETYASVAKMGSIRVLLAITAAQNLECQQYDIVTAFLNAIADKVIYVEQPHSFANGPKVCRLNRALYGLKQAPAL
jgi:hypothetical protein